MIKYWLNICLLWFLIPLTLAQANPPNSHVLGDSWYCNDGYERRGNQCNKLAVPPNAHVLGDSWYCNDGYERRGNQCNKLAVPPNAHVLGNSWYCNDGYERRGNQCNKLAVPPNAQVLGNSWYCNDGFIRAGNQCRKMTAQEIQRLRQYIASKQVQAQDELLLFGGERHDVFLGCINCSKYDTDSIHNQYGTYGSKYASDSIFNSYSQWGSRYSNTSVCNPYANDPPVIVDKQGGFYGTMTVNRYHRNNANSDKINMFLAGLCNN